MLSSLSGKQEMTAVSVSVALAALEAAGAKQAPVVSASVVGAIKKTTTTEAFGKTTQVAVDSSSHWL